MKKIDFKKELKNLYKPSAKKVEIVKVPEMNFIMINGAGDPNNSIEYAQAIEALFSLSYTLKFMIKKGEMAIDYGVLPLEGLWWADDMKNFAADKSKWKWTAIIMQPDFITKEMIDKATEEVKEKKNPPSLSKVRFESFKEGKSAQIMHIGPFSEEGPTIKKVHEFIKESNSQIRGKHHEIYLSDIRRTNPEKWKTVIRQPMR